MTWASPEWFWAFSILPIIIGLTLYRHFTGKKATLTYSSVDGLDQLPGNWKSHIHWFTKVCSWSAIALIIMALARPQLQHTTVERNAEGVDIVLAIDISTSMRAEDLKPNRFEAARNVAKDFIDGRISDRIGLVVFARKSFTVVPPTLDYRLLKQLLDDTDIGTIEDGTAIGMGIATSINRLKTSPAKSKVIILLTDGENNSGEIDPVTAADLAVTHDIKVYTIGAGTKGTAPYPTRDPVFGRRYSNLPVNIDEEMLTTIADMTDGAYFRATNTDELQGIYEQIDELETTEIEEIIYTDYEDLYPRYLLIGISLLCLVVLIDKVWLRTILS